MTYIEFLEYVNIHQPVKYSEVLKVFPPKTRVDAFIRSLRKKELIQTYYFALVFNNNRYIPKKVYFDVKPPMVGDYFIELSENAKKILERENTDSFYETSMYLRANVMFGLGGVKLYNKEHLEYKETVEKIQERRDKNYREKVIEAVKNALFEHERPKLEDKTRRF